MSLRGHPHSARRPRIPPLRPRGCFLARGLELGVSRPGQPRSMRALEAVTRVHQLQQTPRSNKGLRNEGRNTGEGAGASVKHPYKIKGKTQAGNADPVSPTNKAASYQKISGERPQGSSPQQQNAKISALNIPLLPLLMTVPAFPFEAQPPGLMWYRKDMARRKKMAPRDRRGKERGWEWEEAQPTLPFRAHPGPHPLPQ